MAPIDGMVAEAASLTGDIILTESRHPRAVKPASLTDEFSKHGIIPRLTGSVAEAVKLALAGANPDDLICAAGSVFAVAEVIEEAGG